MCLSLPAVSFHLGVYFACSVSPEKKTEKRPSILINFLYPPTTLLLSRSLGMSTWRWSVILSFSRPHNLWAYYHSDGRGRKASSLIYLCGACCRKLYLLNAMPLLLTHFSSHKKQEIPVCGFFCPVCFCDRSGTGAETPNSCRRGLFIFSGTTTTTTTTRGPNVRFYFYPYNVEYSTKWASVLL